MTNYDNFAETFSKSRQNHPWPELDFILSDIERHGYMSILDIGCGNGRFIENYELGIMNYESRYLGVDNSPLMIEEAQRLHPEYEFVVCDMLTLGDSEILKSGLFDAVVFLASFHHLEAYEDRIQVLCDIRKILAPVGRIYMTNWNLRDQEKYKNSHQGDGDYDIKIGEYSRYYHGFTLDELDSLFHEAGYTIEKNEVWEGGRNIVSVIQ